MPVLHDDPELDAASPRAVVDGDSGMGDHAVVDKRRGTSSTGDEGDGTGDRAVAGNRPRASDDEEAARALSPGVMFDKRGRMCKVDVVGRLYEVYEDGVRVTKRGTTRPKGFSPDESGRKRNTEKRSISGKV